MTYRKFKACARRVREDAVSSVGEPWRAAAQPANRPSAGRVCRVRFGAAVAAAACAALLVGLFLTRFRPAEPLSDGGSSSSGSHTLVMQAPTWYAHGSVTVEELVFDSETDRGGCISEAGVLDVSYQASPTPAAGHETCSGVYYYAATGETVCCTHIAQAALQAAGLWEKGGVITVVDYQAARRSILFSYESNKGRRAYLYDGQTLTPLNGILHHTGAQIGGSLWEESERTHSLLLNTAADGEESLLLVDLRSGEVKTVAPWSHKCAEDACFSPTGKYVVYTKGVSDTASLQRDTVVYTVADGTSRQIKGLVRHILTDDSGMVVETPDGLMLFTPDTGKLTPFTQTNLPAHYRFHVQPGTAYTNDCRRLTVQDMLTGETVELPSYVYAWQVDREGRYLYYYVREAAGIVCRDIATGQEFSVPVSENFVEMQRRYGDKEIFFYLLADEKNNTLQLSYIRYDRPRTDPEAVRQHLEGDVSYQYTACVQNGVSSLSDFTVLIARFPDGLALYEGEGYAYLDCTAWLGRTAYWVEDYRKDLFYFVSYDGNGAGTAVSLSGVCPLPADSQNYTRELARTHNLSVGTATFDYGQLLTDGGVDEEALAAYNRAADRLMAVTTSYFVYTRDGYDGVLYGRESADDLQQLREFLNFINTLNFRHTSSYGKYQDAYEMMICLHSGTADVESVWLGRLNGTPVVVVGTAYAHCDEGAYTLWRDWAADKAAACQMPPEEEPAYSTTPSSSTAPPTRRSGYGLS